MGTKLFVAWFDRRNAGTNNSLIQTYGTFGTLPITGTNNFATNFLISTVQFLPVFTGTNTISGTYDPAFPPSVAPASTNCCGAFGGTYAGYMGDYDTVDSDNSYVYYTWGDNRNTSTETETGQFYGNRSVLDIGISKRCGTVSGPWRASSEWNIPVRFTSPSRMEWSERRRAGSPFIEAIRLQSGVGTSLVGNQLRLVACCWSQTTSLLFGVA
jgi:hypothetical protein